MRKLFLNLFLVAGVVVEEGCVSWYNAGHLASSPWNFKVPAPKSISVIAKTEVIIEGCDNPIDSTTGIFNGPLVQAQAIEAYRNAGLFSEVKTGLADTDYLVEIVLKDKRTFKGQLGIAFGYFSDDLGMESKVSDRKGNILCTSVQSVGMKTMFGILVLPGMVFRSSPAMVKKLLFNLARASIIEMQEKGVFHSVGNAPVRVSGMNRQGAGQIVGR
jgi:hypothetical protein